MAELFNCIALDCTDVPNKVPIECMSPIRLHITVAVTLYGTAI